MNSNDRISRRQRLKRLQNYKTWIALALAIILLSLVIERNFGRRIGDFLASPSVMDMFQNGDNNGLDSLVFRAGRSFSLNSQPLIDTVSVDSAGIAIIRYTQRWPSGLPPVFYAERIQELSASRGIECECVQFEKGDSLVCDLDAGGGHRARAVVKPDKTTRLEGRYLGIILKNLYRLDNRQIKEVVDSGIPFGYLADSDVFPAGEVKKVLQSRNASSILSISASAGILAKNNVRKKGDLSAYRSLASDLLNRHPNPAFIDLERSVNIDYAFVEQLVDQAKAKKINYLYRQKTIDRIDSLAFSAGLTFLDYSRINDYTEKGFDQVRTNLFSALLFSPGGMKMIVTVDISKTGVGGFLKMLRDLRGIGVNIIYINRLIDYPEFRIEDL